VRVNVLVPDESGGSAMPHMVTHARLPRASGGSGRVGTPSRRHRRLTATSEEHDERDERRRDDHEADHNPVG
jgi:hypothetical protein